MITQIIFGEGVDILDQNEKWYMIRCHHDQYEGWVDKKQLTPGKDTSTEKTVSSLFAQIRHGDETIIAPAGSFIDRSQSVYELISGEVITIPGVEEARPVREIAMQFLGTPYLWGGRTCMGIDCSGFTQIVFRLLGKNIKRDAYQQAEQGEPITFIEEAQTGDLAFFDNSEGRITHVGIILREDSDIMIIHASGKVRLDALDHQGIFNRETGEYSHQLRLIKRI